MPKAASEFLKCNIGKIMKIWEVRVRREVKAAPEQKSLALRNSLPEYLTELVESLSGAVEGHTATSAKDLDGQTLVGAKHGRMRAKSTGYTIDQLISEYHILRQTIFEVMAEGVAFSNLERAIIIDSIEQAVNDAATEFSDYLKTNQEIFSRTLVHDLRGPLATVVFSLGSIESSPENEVHNRKIQGVISKNLERIGAMLTRLLDYSSIKSGRGLDLQFEQIDLHELICKVTDELNFLCANRFVVKASQTLLGFWDVRGVTSILENLATNALKYSAPDTPIVISAESQKGWVKIVVHNQGEAISFEDQANLFQQFRRAKNVKKKSGWGLGLTIVKSITESHKGYVNVESLENTGTSFTVELPIDYRQHIESPFSRPA